MAGIWPDLSKAEMPIKPMPDLSATAQALMKSFGLFGSYRLISASRLLLVLEITTNSNGGAGE
jgi:hypothetical protein